MLAAAAWMVTDGARALEQDESTDGALAPAVIRSVNVLEAPSGAVDVELAAVEPLSWKASVELDGTLVVRLDNSIVGPSIRKSVRVSHPLLKRIQVRSDKAREGASTRVELSPSRMLAMDVSTTERGLRLRLRDRATAQAAVATTDQANTSTADLPVATESLPATVDLPLTPPVDPYRIGPGDELSIDVFGIDELQRTVRVQPDGRIALPILGRLSLQKLTLEEAEARIATMLRERRLATNPEVFVTVTEYQSQGVFVQGAVARPGLYQVPGGRRLVEVLSSAGGLSQRDPSGQKIFVMRSDGQVGEPRRMEVDAYRLLALADTSLNVLILPGDMIMVPEPLAAKVFVTGAVTAPGAVEGSSATGLTVLQAITAAGGPTPRARLTEINVIRRQPDGTQQTFSVNLKRIRSGRDPDVQLQDGDTVVVREWFF